MIPPELSHSYVEVRVDGKIHAIDSYIVGSPLLKGAQARLDREGRSLGYGARIDSVNVWDGHSNAFSQFDPRMMIEDHGRVDDVEAYFRDRKYRHRAFGLSFNAMFKLMGEFGVAPMNAHIERIRQQE